MVKTIAELVAISGVDVEAVSISYLQRCIRQRGFLVMAVAPEARPLGFVAYYATMLRSRSKIFGVVHCHANSYRLFDESMGASFGLSDKLEGERPQRDTIVDHLTTLAHLLGPTSFAGLVKGIAETRHSILHLPAIGMVGDKMVAGCSGEAWRKHDLQYPLGMLVERCGQSPDMLATHLPMTELHLLSKCLILG